MRRSWALIRTLTALAAVVTLIAGCGGTGPGAIEALAARQQSGTGSSVFRDVSELTVNHLYQVGDKTPAPVTTAVIRGRIAEVAQGRAFAVPGGDAPDGTLTDFDDGDAQWRTFHLTVNVAEAISGDVPGAAVVVGLAFGPAAELDTVRKDLLAMGEMVFFLERSPVFGYDPTVYGIVGDGSLLATVSETGQLALPVLDSERERSLLSRGGTLTELRAIAKEPPVVIRLDPTGTQRANHVASTAEPQPKTK